MVSLFWKTSDSLDHQLPTTSTSNNHSNNPDESLPSRLGFKAVLVFCSTRVLRGGARSLMLPAIAFILTIFILFGLLPNRLNGGGYKDVLSWSSSDPAHATNLRIVVFGSPDLAGSAVDATHQRTTWTEQLCAEMECSSHISLVPHGEASHGLTSNRFYAREFWKLQNITAQTNVTEKPASDYSFIAEQYPIPEGTPDLEAQVGQFLAMPAPEVAPHETLWVFTLGTWEVWNLAAMPKKTGEDLVQALIEYIFHHVERVYVASLNPKSIAFSDFWSNATDAEIQAFTASDAFSKVDVRKLENFRVVVPKLFDITLTPGWKNRPEPPFPHSSAEQTRKAATLTKLWNDGIDAELQAWEERGTNKADDMPKDDPIIEIPKASWLLQYLPDSLRPKQSGFNDQGEPVIFAPYPLRNGWISKQADMILKAMTEEEMQRGGVRDSNGLGSLSINDTMRFLDVWKPCVRGETDDLSVDSEEAETKCEEPNNHLFYDAFTVSQRAIEGLAKSVAEGLKKELFLTNEEKPGWFYR